MVMRWPLRSDSSAPPASASERWRVCWLLSSEALTCCRPKATLKPRCKRLVTHSHLPASQLTPATLHSFICIVIFIAFAILVSTSSTPIQQAVIPGQEGAERHPPERKSLCLVSSLRPAWALLPWHRRPTCRLTTIVMMHTHPR